MKIRSRIMIMAVLTNLLLVVSIFAITFFKANAGNNNQIDQIEALLIKEKQEYLKDIVKISYSVLVEASKLEDELAAKELAKKLLSTPRYDIDGSAYLFAYKIRGNNEYGFAFHGTKPALWNKKTNIDNPDPNGVTFRRMLIESAVKGGSNGGDFVYYKYAKGGSKGLKPKMAYSIYFPKWNWVLVGGIYLDNIEQAKQEQVEILSGELTELLLFVLLFSVFISIISLLCANWLSLKISQPITEAAETLKVLSTGETNINIDITGNDEITVMQMAMDQLKDSMNVNAGIAESIAAGDLTAEVIPISESDRLGNAFKGMTEKLNSVMSYIMNVSVEVEAGARMVSSSSQSQSEGAMTSASSVEEMSSSMVEIESQIRSSADNATQANQLAAEASKSAETGTKQMDQMLAAMSGISESSEKIAKVIKVIDVIAFQTNLLALNASVEAARAGTKGKGFAVVADEVRNLAGRCSKAARETAELIEDATRRVKNGNEIADHTGTALTTIVQQINKVTDLGGEIAAAANEQALNVAHVTQGLEQIDSVTQSNTANAEETASASEELSVQATELQKAISRFKLSENLGLISNKENDELSAPEPQILPAYEKDNWGQEPSLSDLEDDYFQE